MNFCIIALAVLVLSPSLPAQEPKADPGASCCEIVRAQRIRVSERMSRSLLIKKVDPIPPDALNLGPTEVVLQALIDPEGNVQDLKIVSHGHPLLVKAAIDAAKQYKYKPYQLNGQPVSVETQITVSLSSSLASSSAAAGQPDSPYRNSTYSFTCKIPAGWVLRTKEMNASSPAAAKGTVLLAAFERPPEANDSTPSSTIVIASEPASSYPGLKTAADYLDPLTAAITAKGSKAVADPYEFTIGSTKLVRADFSKTKDKTTIYQSTLVELTRGDLVSFTFLATSEDELDQLVSNLKFGIFQLGPH